MRIEYNRGERDSRQVPIFPNELSVLGLATNS